METRQPSTTILMGGYGGGNFGDEMICFVLSRLIKELSPSSRLTIFTFNRKVSASITSGVNWMEYKNLPFTLLWFKTFRSIFDLKQSFTALREIKAAKVILLGGGGLLYDYNLFHLIGWASRVLLIRLLGKKYSFIMNSFSDPKSKIGRLLIRWMIKHAEKISVRDTLSQQYCARNSRPDAKLCNDPVFLLPYFLQKDGQDIEKKRKVLLAPRPWGQESENIKAWSNLISHLLEWCKDYSIYLLAMDPRMDKTLCQKIEALNKGKCKMLALDYSNLRELLSEISSAQLVITMRLHAAILSFSVGTTPIGISYDDKVSGLFTNMNKAYCCLSWKDFVSNFGLSKIYEIFKNCSNTTSNNINDIGLFSNVEDVVTWHLIK